MSPAQLYRPSPKWPIAAAFTFAAVIHLSMVALASHHRALPPAPFIDDVPVVGGEDPPPESTPEPENSPPEETVAPPANQDFIDAPTPPTHQPRRPQTGPMRPSAHPGPVSLGNIRPALVSAPRPEYPYEARRRHLTGAGIAILTVNSTSGFVLDARMEQSTGDPILDRAAVSAFRRWRFRSGAPASIRIPVTFTLTGASF